MNRPPDASGPDVDGLRRVAETGREALREIWARRDDRERLDPPARRLLELLEAHKEFRPFWEGAAPEEGVNPFLHVFYHDVVRKQFETGEPPEARDVLQRLQATGLDAHEAEHKVMEALIREMFDMISRRGAFDSARYRRTLETLGR